MVDIKEEKLVNDVLVKDVTLLYNTDWRFCIIVHTTKNSRKILYVSKHDAKAMLELFSGAEITKHDHKIIWHAGHNYFYTIWLPIGNYLHEDLKMPLDTSKSFQKFTYYASGSYTALGNIQIAAPCKSYRF